MSLDIEKYVIKEHFSVKEALVKVENNHFGMIFISSDSGEIIGLATDGDIRRALLRGVSLDDMIIKCANKEFLWADISSSRENLIKKLDGHINFLPLLDSKKNLKTIISRNYLPLPDEEEIFIRARAPVRVSFGGGGSDVTHYFSGSSGAVINAAISLYSHATMKIVNNSSIAIHSLDLDDTLRATDLKALLKHKGPFGLIVALLKVVQPRFGFELYLHSDFPIGSGLGGSATLSAAVLGCFNMTRKDRWDRHQLAEIAFQAERLYLGVAGGWQDQYATVFGGVNFLEFDSDQNIVNPMRIHDDTIRELEESLVLCDTGVVHNSGNIHNDQKKTMNSAAIKKKVKQNVSLTYNIRNYLLRGKLDNFGLSLHEAWQLKRNFSAMISNDYIDEIYNGALDNGALGGKLLGAGGGGFFIFYVSPFRKHELLNYLRKKDLAVHPFKFEPNGMQSWTSRLNSNEALFKEI